MIMYSGSKFTILFVMTLIGTIVLAKEVKKDAVDKDKRETSEEYHHQQAHHHHGSNYQAGPVNGNHHHHGSNYQAGPVNGNHHHHSAGPSGGGGGRAVSYTEVIQRISPHHGPRSSPYHTAFSSSPHYQNQHFAATPIKIPTFKSSAAVTTPAAAAIIPIATAIQPIALVKRISSPSAFPLVHNSQVHQPYFIDRSVPLAVKYDQPSYQNYIITKVPLVYQTSYGVGAGSDHVGTGHYSPPAPAVVVGRNYDAEHY